MDVALIESKYADLKRAFEAGQLTADAYQTAVEDLRTQDDYGRYWLIGAETGEWYYFDGAEWLSADPRQADTLPVVDENGVYWMLGKETNEWYYFDGQNWIRPQPVEQPAAEPATPAQDATQYYEDEQGRYWAKGAQSGQWYYYDQTGWHRSEELPQPTAPSTAPYPGEPQPYQPQTVPFQPVYPAPSYLQTEAPVRPASAPYSPQAQPQPQYTQPVPPAPAPYYPPAQPVSGPTMYTQPVQPAPAPYYPPAQPPAQPVSGPTMYTQPVQPAPAPYYPPAQPASEPTMYTQPVQPAPAPYYPPAQPASEPTMYTQPVQPAPAPYYPPTQPAPAEPQPTTPPAKAHMEPGVWYYSDGEQWLRYQENPAEAAPAEAPVVSEETPPAEEPLEAGMWYYFDGEQWLGYQQPPAGVGGQSAPSAEAPVSATTPAAEEYVEIAEDEIFVGPDDEIELDGIDDLEDFVEVVEVNDDDIILDENLVEADFQVEVFKPGEETIPAARPVAPVAASPAQPTPSPAAPAGQAQSVPAVEQPVTSTTPVMRTTVIPEQARPVPMEIATPAKTGDVSKTPAAKPAPKPAGSGGSLLKALPVWLWTSLGGVVTLVLVAALIIGVVYLLNNKKTGAEQIAGLQTPTLPAAVAEAITPTPALTPTPTATQLPSPTTVPLTNYASNYFGFSLAYPSGWVLKEEDDLVIFAPSARSLNRDVINGASVWVVQNNSTDLSQLLADNLEKFSPISKTLNEGMMTIGEQSWASAQISYQSADMGAEAIALIASTALDNAGYTLIAAAPASEWDDYKPLFQSVIDSFKFTRQTVAQLPTSAEPVATEATEAATSVATIENTPTPAATATHTPTATATPVPTKSGPITYIVEAGDTLGGIAYQFDVDLDDLIKANNLPDKDVILQIGQELIIPQAGQMVIGAVTATPKTTKTATATPTRKAGQTPTPTAGKNATPTAQTTPVATATKAPTSAPVANANLSGRIAYPVYSTDIMSFNIWSTKVDGSDTQIIAGNASQPKYNRDGSLLAYRSWNQAKRGLYFVDTVSGRQDFLTTFTEDALPSWYTDGTVVFPSRREGDRVSRLFKVDQAGQGAGLGFNSDYVDVLPTNQLIARGCTPSGDCGLWLLQPDGSGETKIGNYNSDTAPAAKPQGGSFAFMSYDRESAGNWEIWKANVDGSNPVRLTNNSANDGLPAWSPDGQSIAFVSDRGGTWGIWAMNADGSNQRKLFDMPGAPTGQVLHDVTNSKGWLEERITWIP